MCVVVVGIVCVGAIKTRITIRDVCRPQSAVPCLPEPDLSSCPVCAAMLSWLLLLLPGFCWAACPPGFPLRLSRPAGQQLCLGLVPGPASWYRAKRLCIARAGQLAELTSQQESEAVVGDWPDREEELWLGGDSQADPSGLGWVWSHSAAPIRWAELGRPGPLTSPPADCLALTPSNTWTGLDCNRNQSFLCQRPEQSELEFSSSTATLQLKSKTLDHVSDVQCFLFQILRLEKSIF